MSDLFAKDRSALAPTQLRVLNSISAASRERLDFISRDFLESQMGTYSINDFSRREIVNVSSADVRWRSLIK